MELLVQHASGIYKTTGGDDLAAEMHNNGQFINASGMLPIHIGCEQGNAQIVRTLIEASSPQMLLQCASCYCACSSQGRHRSVHVLPIHLACMSGDVATVRLLLENDILPGLDACTIPEEKHCLHLAAELGHQPLMEFFLARAPDQGVRSLRAAASQAAAGRARLYWSRFGFASKVVWPLAVTGPTHY